MSLTRTAMKISKPRAVAARRQRSDAGMSLIELMFAMLILAIGLGGLTVLFICICLPGQQPPG
jgi:prepilin-type N-terminal cleavage/methylation domain-containing protein